MPSPISAAFSAMGCDAHVVIVIDRPERSVDFMRIARSAIATLEQRWSRFEPSSDVSRINASPGVPVQVHPSTASLINQAIDAWVQTAGSFDPTVATSLLAAGYRHRFVELPSLSTASTVPAPSPIEVEVHLTASTVTVPEGVAIDLGGIGKGAAADIVVETLLDAGADAAMVNIGGDLRAEGDHPGGWTVELDCPGADVTRQIRIGSGAVCTSSVVKRRWRTVDGERHHIIEPTTGASTSTDLLSASVIGASAAQCEVLATTAVALGSDAAAEVITSHRASGVLVNEAGRVLDVGPVGSFT